MISTILLRQLLCSAVTVSLVTSVSQARPSELCKQVNAIGTASAQLPFLADNSSSTNSYLAQTTAKNLESIYTDLLLNVRANTVQQFGANLKKCGVTGETVKFLKIDQLSGVAGEEIAESVRTELERQGWSTQQIIEKISIGVFVVGGVLFIGGFIFAMESIVPVYFIAASMGGGVAFSSQWLYNKSPGLVRRMWIKHIRTKDFAQIRQAANELAQRRVWELITQPIEASLLQ